MHVTYVKVERKKKTSYRFDRLDELMKCPRIYGLISDKHIKREGYDQRT